MSTIQEITDEIREYGGDGLHKAAYEFEQSTIERDILEYSLQVYYPKPAHKRAREVTLQYADADFCLFQLDEHEDEPFVRRDPDDRNPAFGNDPLPTWWLLGTDDLRESGLTLMEYPGDTEEIDSWTRGDILDGLDLERWQSVSQDEARDLDYDTDYRLSGRLGITRWDPDEYLADLQESGIDVGWDEIEEPRDTSATRIASHLLTFEDASDIIGTFDPLRETDSGDHVNQGISEVVYVVEDSSVSIVSNHYQNRHLELGEGVYDFPKIGVRRRQKASPPSYEPPSRNTAPTSRSVTLAAAAPPASTREFLATVRDTVRAWRTGGYGE